MASTTHNNNNDNRDKLFKLQSSTSKSLLIKEKENILNIQEISVTIRRSEKGYGFELTDGINITKVHQNSPAFNAGILEGDIVKKVNGTSIHDKAIIEITRMIHESNPFVALTLQRKLYSTITNTNRQLNELNNGTNDETNYLKQNNNNDIYDIDKDNIMNKFDLISPKHHYNGNNDDTARSLASRNSSRRIGVKKATTEVKSRFHQTQSLTDISITMMDNNNKNTINGSQSDNENDVLINKHDDYNNNNNNNENDDDDILIPYKDDINNDEQLVNLNENDKVLALNNNKWSLSLNSMILIDDLISNAITKSRVKHKSQIELDGYEKFNDLLAKSINLATFLNYLVSEATENPKYLYFYLFTDELVNLKEKNDVFMRCTNEIYTTFLMYQSPLKLELNEELIRDLEDLLGQCSDKATSDQVSTIKHYLIKLKEDSIQFINNQLIKYHEVKSLGLANMFQSDAFRTPQNKSDSSLISELFKNYLVDLSVQSSQITDWNDPRPNEALISALISCFLTYLKRYAITMKTLGRFEYEKIPLFLNKKYKTKKSQTIQKLGHIFSDTILPIRSVCSKCNVAFWGIGNQGLICIKSKCEIKLHRSCLNSGITFECHGTLKTNIKDDTFSSFKRMLRNSFISTDFDKKKDDESSKSKFYDPEISDEQSSSGLYSHLSSSSSNNSNTNRHFTIKDGDEGCLPVKKAIEKYEKISSINNEPNVKPTSPLGHAPKIIATIETSQITEITNKKDKMNSILPNKTTNNFNILNNNNANANQSVQSSNLLSANNNNSTNACKRVGSFKIDIKKNKANIPRSKSDPEPEEIKNAITSSNTIINTPSTLTITNNSVLNDSNTSSSSNTTTTTATSTSAPINISSNNDNNSSKSYQASRISSLSATGDGDERIHTLDVITHSNSSCSDNLSVHSATHSTHPFSSSSSLPSSGPSMLSLTSNSYSTSVHSWMIDSDVEVEDELPSIHSRDSSVDNLSKQDRKVQEVINELIHTEQKHVRNLKIMKNHFYIPIKIDYLLNDSELELLFPNLEEILELHSELNNQLKKLRKENPIVPLDDLIEVILSQFEGEKGAKFEEACARFCKDQKEAMELLRSKMRMINEKFSQFLMRAETEPICRKLHLKDFIPTEVQRLTKYGLLFRELNKITEDEIFKKKLEKCMNASTRISQYVNKAVTECENKKRVKEIQSKLDTTVFDQYFAKSSLLKPYRNLDISSRKLIYEGELEWKISKDGNPKFMVLLFEDILVFLDRSSTTGRYSLKPMMCSIGKERHTFTPLIRVADIHQIKEMPDKRGFHMTVFIDDVTKSVKKKLESKMLFILDAKSGDERNKWTSYLQELSGVKIAKSFVGGVDNSGQTSISSNSTSSSKLNIQQESTIVKQNADDKVSITSTIDEVPPPYPALNDDSNETNADLLPKITPALTQYEQEAELTNQLEENTRTLLKVMTERSTIISQLMDIQASDMPQINYPSSNSSKQANSNSILYQCDSLLKDLTETLVKETSLPLQSKLLDTLTILHNNIHKLRSNNSEIQSSDLPAISTSSSISDKSRNNLRRTSNSSDTTLVTVTPANDEDDQSEENDDNEYFASQQNSKSLKQADINELSEDEVIHGDVSFDDVDNSFDDKLLLQQEQNDNTTTYNVIIKSDKIKRISSSSQEVKNNENDGTCGDDEEDEVTSYYIHNETNDEVSHV